MVALRVECGSFPGRPEGECVERVRSCQGWRAEVVGRAREAMGAANRVVRMVVLVAAVNSILILLECSGPGENGGVVVVDG